LDIKQVVVTGQNQVELQKATMDENLGPNELLIETEYTFISTGTELANYTGKEPKVFQPGAWCAYPWRSGYANVGIVKAVGAQARRAKDDIDPGIATASRMAGVAATAFIVAEIKGNPWVAVFGLGLVGNLASQLLKIKGCRVIGVDPVEYRRKLAEKCGIEYTLGGDAETVHKGIAEITNGSMANITVDAVGHSAVVMQALKETASHGQIVILGSPRVTVQGDLTELLGDVHIRWITIRGALEWCIPIYPEGAEGISQFTKQQMIFDWLRNGKLDVKSLISHRLKPEQIKQAYDGLLNEPQTYTGVLLEWK
jgi:threonine dehydrogenase-like Zn-dependent dehydrogenase